MDATSLSRAGSGLPANGQTALLSEASRGFYSQISEYLISSNIVFSIFSGVVRYLMAKMAHACEYHGDSGVVGGGDDLIVAHRAARLDDRGGARRDSRLKPVGIGKESVRSDHRAGRRAFGETRGLADFRRLPRGDARAVDAAHLSGA